MKFPPEILNQHIAVLGKTGSGKTSTAKLIVEQVAAEGARVCILDPIKSDWWGLTSSRDGKRPGLPFHILGGPRGHVPLHSAAGKAIGEIVASGAMPLSILDMADFNPGGHAQFFIDFAQTLLRKMRGVVYLVIEEAHLFAPKERSGIGAENMAIHYAKTLATAGRSKGIRLMVLTQRTQALHNALLGSCDTLIAHRFTAPADQKPIVDWLKANVDSETMQKVSAGLSSLKTGEAWLCAGEAKIFECRQFPHIATFDNSRTPVDGEEQIVKTAPVDAGALKAIIGDAVKEAEANDPKLLKSRIAELERAVAKAPTATVEKIVEERVEVPALKEAEIKRLEAAVEKLLAAAEKLQHDGDYARNSAADIQRGLKVFNTAVTQRPVTISRRMTTELTQAGMEASARNHHHKFRDPQPSSDLPDGERKILTALAQYPDGLERDQLSILTGYKRSTRDTYVQRLSGKAFVIQQGSKIIATDEGVSALGNFEPLPTGDALRDYWLTKLPEGEALILSHLISAYPKGITRDDLTTATDYKRSTRDTYLQRLSTRRLVVNENGCVAASAELFD